MFEPMLRVPEEWPSRYERFRNGVVVLDPFNATSATVAEIKKQLNATVVMYWDTNDLLMPYKDGQCLHPGARDCGGRWPGCSTGHVKCCLSFDCDLASAPLCGPDPFPSAVAQAFDPAWAVRQVATPPGRGPPVPQCLYYFGLQYVPFARSVAALGALLSSWVKERNFDGVYFDEYFDNTVFQRIFTDPRTGVYANHTLDVNGDGVPETLTDIQAQYARWRTGVTAALRRELGPSAVLIANTAGPGADPSLNGITLEMEACRDADACAAWFRDQAAIGAKPPLSVIWTCDEGSMPVAQQCQNAARFQAELPWVQVGTAWYDGPRVLCNATDS